MSKKVTVPDTVVKSATEIIGKLNFKGLMDMFLKGPCRHTVIEPDEKFEIVAISIKCVGDKIFEFTFGLTHECDDDRSWWVVDDTISVTRRYEQ
jgi:hypothetical protein